MLATKTLQGTPNARSAAGGAAPVASEKQLGGDTLSAPDVDFSALLPTNGTPWFEEVKGTLLRELPDIDIGEDGEWRVSNVPSAAEDPMPSMVQLRENSDGTLSLPEDDEPATSTITAAGTTNGEAGAHSRSTSKQHVSGNHLDDEFFAVFDHSSLLVDMALERMFPNIGDMLPELSFTSYAPDATDNATGAAAGGDGGALTVNGRAQGNSMSSSSSTSALSSASTASALLASAQERLDSVRGQPHALSQVEFSLSLNDLDDENVVSTDIGHTQETASAAGSEGGRSRLASVEFGINSLLMPHEAPQFVIDDKQLEMLLEME
ncbi:hypothetical protein RI367_000702 [Sorochytrium milnesiophthora]